MDVQNYIKPELLILIPALYFIGMWLKKSRLPDKWIPLTLGLVSIFLAAVWILSTGNLSNFQDAASAFFTAVTQGVLIAGASVYANQLYVQINKEE